MEIKASEGVPIHVNFKLLSLALTKKLICSKRNVSLLLLLLGVEDEKTT